MTSFLEELRAAHDRVMSSATKVLPVPERGLPPSRWPRAVRFRAPSNRDKIAPIIATYREGAAPSTEQVLQLIIDCHDEVLRRDANGGWAPADPDGGPLRFDASDERWGLGDSGTARQAVAALYHLDAQPLALDGTVETLVDWLQGMDIEALLRVEGESAGGGT